MATLQDLVDVLVRIELTDEIQATDYLHRVRPDGTIAEDGELFAGDQHPLICTAVGLADELLINSDGNPNFEQHKMLAASGFKVTKGESDSFGWLTGCVHTKKGVLVYG